MPNYVKNRLSFRGDAETIAFILDFIKGEKSAIDFNSIIPMPVGLKDTFSGNTDDPEKIKAIRMAQLRYGYPSWYEWSCSNWGTKWNACDTESIEDGVVFDTAWAAPEPIVKKLAKCFPEVEITHKWADEDYGYNCGESVYFMGNETYDFPEGGSKEAYEMAFDLWPDASQYYRLVGDNYECIDED